ncbi:MAG: pilus assembly protein PilM [Candidatus Omnitrophota bacterium]
MFGNDKRYLSFSLNESVIKIVQAKSSGVVEKVARASASDVSLDNLGGVLKTLLNGFDRKAAVICAIPASVVTSKIIEVPSSDPQEIKAIINLQVSRHTPYSREEVLVGFFNLGPGSPNNTKVLLVIAHRNVIKDRLTILEKASLSADKILFVPEGVGRLYSKGLNLKKESAPLGVIDVSLQSVNFMVVAKGAVTFSRSIPIGIKQIIESQEIVTKILEEINKSIAAYTSDEGEAAIGSFVITTDNDVVNNLLPALKEGLKSEVRISSYVNLIKTGSVKSKLQRDFADDSFLDVIAPVVSVAKCEVNLMPEEMILKKTVERQSKEAIKTVVASLLILILLGATIMSKIYFKDAFLNQNLKARFASQKQEVQNLQGHLNKIKIVRQYLQSRMISLDIIREFYKITPPQIYLSSIVFDESGELMITGISASPTGISDSMSQVYSYEKILSGSSFFQKVTRKAMATKKDSGKDVVTFELALQVVG